MNTFWEKSPTTLTPVDMLRLGDVVNHRHSLWRVHEITVGKTTVALRCVRYRGRSTRVITVAPGGHIAVVDGAHRPVAS